MPTAPKAADEGELRALEDAAEMLDERRSPADASASPDATAATDAVAESAEGTQAE